MTKREWFWIFNVMFISLPRKCNYGTLTKIVFCWISFRYTKISLSDNYILVLMKSDIIILISRGKKLH